MQLLALLVLDEGLVKVGLVVEDVDEGVDDAALAAHDQVEVAQAQVEVDPRDLVPGEREARREARAGGGLAHASLAGGHDDDSGHRFWSFQSFNASITSVSPASRTCAGLPCTSAGSAVSVVR